MPQPAPGVFVHYAEAEAPDHCTPECRPALVTAIEAAGRVSLTVFLPGSFDFVQVGRDEGRERDVRGKRERRRDGGTWHWPVPASMRREGG